MVRSLDTGLSVPGSSPCRVYYVVFLGTEDTLFSQCASPPKSVNEY